MTGEKSVLLFIGGISEEVSRKELERFVVSATNDFFSRLPFVRKPVVERCEIVRIDDLESNGVEYHGLVAVQPAKLAMKIIERLQGARIRGQLVEVRKYFRRSHYKDRRRDHINLDLLSNERRANDRRRSKIRIKTVKTPHIFFEGLADHARILI